MLGVVFIFGIVIFVITISQLALQKERIQEKGLREARILSEETGDTLGELNQQIARDFSSSCTKYFNTAFANIRKHVGAVQDNLSDQYRKGKGSGVMDDQVGLVKGVSAEEVSEEFGRICQVRDFIKNLPDYDGKDVSRLDLYAVTESGMCLDGTGTALGNHYADLRQEDWYKKTKKSGKTYWSGIFKGKVTGKVKVICAMPVYDEKKRFRGCVSGDVAVDAFQKMIDEYDEEQIVSVIFFDQSDQLMYATNGYKNTDQVRRYLGKREIADQGNELYAYTTLEETGWKICLVLSQETVNQTMGKLQRDVEKNTEGIVVIVQDGIQRILLIFAVSMGAGVLLAIIITNFLAGGFVRPVRQLMSQVREVGSGNLDQVIEVRSKNEIGQLAAAFQDMTGELKEYMSNLQAMTADQERVTAEFHVAKQIQRNMLPSQFPAFPDRGDFDIYALIHPVDEGGGNFYDFFLVDKTHFCMVMGDVSGTGIPTTLFAVITKTNVKNYAQLGYPPDRILAETNNQLSDTNEAGLTVSLFLGIVDLVTGQFQYSNAGQLAPLWKHSGEDFEFLEAKPCFALGNMENVPYWKQSVRIAQGDMLFLYTQGVPETRDSKGSEYTQEYLYEFLNSLVKHQYEFQDIARCLQYDLERFMDGEVQRKDSTVMMFRYFGN